jgi:hypothetical protein
MPRGRNEFAEPLVKFWSKLTGTIHPDDQAVFEEWNGDHPFNTGYPPPAFIGNIRTARVFVLKANGGFGPCTTRLEFQAEGTAERYRQALGQPCAAREGVTACYYLELGCLSDWLRSGHAAIVNAVAYRSPKVPPMRFANALPSVRLHRCWLRDHLVKAGRNGDVRIVLHRTGFWNVPNEIIGEHFVMRSHPPNKHLSDAAHRWGATFLGRSC